MIIMRKDEIVEIKEDEEEKKEEGRENKTLFDVLKDLLKEKEESGKPKLLEILE